MPEVRVCPYPPVSPPVLARNRQGGYWSRNSFMRAREIVRFQVEFRISRKAGLGDVNGSSLAYSWVGAIWRMWTSSRKKAKNWDAQSLPATLLTHLRQSWHVLVPGLTGGPEPCPYASCLLWTFYYGKIWTYHRSRQNMLILSSNNIWNFAHFILLCLSPWYPSTITGRFQSKSVIIMISLVNTSEYIHCKYFRMR